MIETPRLLTRRFVAQDYKMLFDYLSNPVVYQFEPGHSITLDEAKELALARSRGTDFWAVVLLETNKLVGHLYFKQVEPLEFMTWELGYIFNPRYQNNGYASEAAAALIRYGFDHFGIHRVMAHCNPENIASWRVLEKIGRRREDFLEKMCISTTPRMVRQTGWIPMNTRCYTRISLTLD